MPATLKRARATQSAHLEVAQPALRLLEVGLEEVERVAELLAPLPRLAESCRR